jgi:hypothetical protein
MIRLDPIARVRVTRDGAAFNRFSTQVVRIGTTPMGPSFYNTATRTHAQVIPNAVIVTTASTRVYQHPGVSSGIISCASDDRVQPALYIPNPIKELCALCPRRGGTCVDTTPTLIASRHGDGWRVLRLDLTGASAKRARAWGQTCYVDWDLEHEADISIGLDAHRTVELSLGPPKRMSPRRARELFELYRLLHLLPLPAAMIKGARRDR